MKERVVTFGNHSQLTGIVTFANIQLNPSRFSVLLLNPGLLHRVGFNRFNTDLARKIQSKGISSLRFDMLGIGDSASYNTSLPYDSQAMIDIDCAIDYLLNTTSSNNCVLIGLCSGADYSHHMAVNDNRNRISGAVLLDGFAYHTLGYYLHDYFPGILNPFKILRFLYKKIILKRLSSMRQSTSILQPENTYTRTFPPKNIVINEMQTIINKGIKLLYIFSGGIPLYYNYENQFKDMFKSVDFKNNVTFRYFKEANHTYTSITQRNYLMQIIETWLVSLNNISVNI